MRYREVLRAWFLELLPESVSQTEFERIYGIQQSTVSAIKGGRRFPTTEHIEQLQAVLKLDADSLCNRLRKVAASLEEHTAEDQLAGIHWGIEDEDGDVPTPTGDGGASEQSGEPKRRRRS